MPGRRRDQRPAPQWSRRRILLLLLAAVLTAAAFIVGLGLTVVHALTSAPSPHQAAPTDSTHAAVRKASGSAAAGEDTPDARDELAEQPMPSVPESAAHPGTVTTTDPGLPIVLPAATSLGAAGVPTGYPRTPAGAIAQLAAIDQTALQSGSLPGARAVITGWALPGGPTATSWSGTRAMGTLLNATGLSGGGSPQLAVVLTPLMGLVKGSLGPDPLAPDFVVPCVDFELDLTLQQTARGAVADCQRMVWSSDRWMIGPGAEPAPPPSVWPDTETALAVGYRDLRRG